MVITRGDSIGGAQLYVQSLAERLQQERHEVLVVMGTPGSLADMLSEAGVSWVVCASLRRQLHPLHDLKSIRDLGRIIGGFKPDLVSAHSSKAGIVGRLASKLNGVPCVFTAHGWSFAGGISQPRGTIWRGIERLAAPLAARIICVSTFDRELALRYGFDPHTLVTIHNGIAERPVAPRPSRAPEAPTRIVMIARFFAQKDHKSLLHAIQATPHCELDLVGDGPLEDSVKDYAVRLGIGQRVHFHGYRPDAAAVLAGADLFVLASHYEGFPLTTLEAMRAALPVIVSDVGGASEAVIDGVTGFAVPGNDVHALRECIRSLVDRPELRAAMGNAGREKYLSSFTFDRMYRTTLTVYEEAARQAASPAVALSRFRAIVQKWTYRGARSDRVRRGALTWRTADHRPGVTTERAPVERRDRRPLWRSVWD